MTVPEAEQGLLWFGAGLLQGQCRSKLGSFWRSGGAVMLGYVEPEPQSCCVLCGGEESLDTSTCEVQGAGGLSDHSLVR